LCTKRNLTPGASRAIRANSAGPKFSTNPSLYRKFSVNWRDVAQYASFPGFWKTLWQNLGSGSLEMKNSLFKSGYLEQCRKYCPSLNIEDLLPYEAGIRAQAVMRDGTLVHDFLFAQTPRMLHVCNAPSPAATSAIPIGAMIADRMFKPD
jgi:L-2-hydroxyglutarate oxidase